MKRVHCLYRVSTKKQVDKQKDDIPMQKITCNEFVEKQQDWIITREFEEKGVSGSKVSAANRDAIQELKEAAVREEFDILLVFMFDRLGRIDDETPFVLEWFVKNGIEVWSALEGQQRIEEHVDKLVNYIRFWQASGESNKLSLRIKERKGQLTADGYYTGGTVPYGYRTVHKGRLNKKGEPLKDFEVDPEADAVKQQIFTKTVYDGYGSHKLSEWLNNQGIRTNNGGKWQCNSIIRVLRNRMSIGYLENKSAKSQYIPELHTIPVEIFDRAQFILDQRSNIFKEKQSSIIPLRTSVNILAGKLYCSTCNTRLSTTVSIDRYTKKDGTVSEKRTRRYVCYHNTRSLTQCDGQGSYDAVKTESLVTQMLSEIFGAIKMTPQEKAVEVRYKKQIKAQKEALKKQEKLIETLTDEMNILKDEVVKTLTGKGSFSAELIAKLVNEKEQELCEATAEKEMLENHINDKQASIDTVNGQYREFVSWADEFQQCSRERAQMIIAHLVDRIEISRNYQVKIIINTVYEQFMPVAA